MSEQNTSKKPEIKISYSEKKPFFLFAKKQSGVALTRAQIKEIKQGREKLRRDMRAQGIERFHLKTGNFRNGNLFFFHRI